MEQKWNLKRFIKSPVKRKDCKFFQCCGLQGDSQSGIIGHGVHITSGQLRGLYDPHEVWPLTYADERQTYDHVKTEGGVATTLPVNERILIGYKRHGCATKAKSAAGIACTFGRGVGGDLWFGSNYASDYG